MRYDFSPFYRSTVGFDRLFDLIDQTSNVEPMTNWPPYNIEKIADDQYRITMAVAGFTPGEIEVVQQEQTLTISGHKQAYSEGVEVLHRGIAGHTFRRTFDLADYVRVNSANLENGLLTIDLVREVPEQMRPLRIPIGSGVSEGLNRDSEEQAEAA